MDDLKVEILFNVMWERAAHFMRVYTNINEMKDYQNVKSLILKEFQQKTEACFEKFLSAWRAKNENHQFASSFKGKWGGFIESL